MSHDCLTPNTNPNIMARVTWNTTTALVRRGNSRDVNTPQDRDLEFIKDEALPPAVPAPP
jgi:hypothetical protein